MQLSTQCPHCDVRIKVRDNMVGQIARCPKCREKFEVSSFSSGGDGGDAAAVSISETIDGSAIKTAGGESGCVGGGYGVVHAASAAVSV